MMLTDWQAAKTEATALAAEWAGPGRPGGAIVLFDAAGRMEHVSGGQAALEHALPFTANTPSRFASISKHFLAVLLLREGVALDATLGSLLPDLPDQIGGVELGRALDMTAALPDMMEVLWQSGIPYTASMGEEAIFAIAKRLPGLNTMSGHEMAYSNTGWRLAQRVLQHRLGIGYALAIERLMAEFDLPIRFAQDESQIMPGLATGYWHDGKVWRRGRYGFHFSASGGLTGSAAALARWFSALLSGRGSLHGMLERLTALRCFANGDQSAYRLGLVCSTLQDVALVGHGGSLPGYRNHVLMAPGHGVGVVVLTNREEDALWPTLRVLAAFLNRDLPSPPDDIQTGLFATAEGPFWAEVTPDAISFMGGYERLVADGADGIRSLPAYLDIRLRWIDPETIEGLIGGVRRRLSRVPAGTCLDQRLKGRWQERNFGIQILIRADGSAKVLWTSGIEHETVLTPLPGGRALANLSHGPWQHRPCLSLQDDGSLLLASHRARIMHFHRCPEGV